jgi:uncharacterized protein YjiS (DUF1127 family)
LEILETRKIPHDIRRTYRPPRSASHARWSIDRRLTKKEAVMTAMSLPLPASSRSFAPGRIFASALDAWLDWSDRRRQLRSFAALDDRMLADLGLSRADVESTRRSARTWHL